MIYAGTWTDHNGHRYMKQTFGQGNRACGKTAFRDRHVTAPSATQTTYRAAMRQLAHAWRNMSDAERLLWISYAGTPPVPNRAGFPIYGTGWTRYLQHRLSAIRTGAPWHDADPTEPIGHPISDPHMITDWTVEHIAIHFPITDPWQGDTYCNIAVYQVPPDNAFDWTDPTATELIYAEDPWPNNNAHEIVNVTLAHTCYNLNDVRLYIRANDNDFNQSWRTTLYATPIIVTGNPNPDCKGSYLLMTGTPPAGWRVGYRRVDGAYYFCGQDMGGGLIKGIIATTAWKAEGKSTWILSTANWPIGSLAPRAPYTGIPVTAYP